MDLSAFDGIPFLVRHAALALAFAVLSTGGKLALFVLDKARMEGSVAAPRFDLRIVPWRLFVSLLVYLTLAGVTYALGNAERVRREAELAARLDPERFLQVHRSHIVNLDAVKVLRPFDDRRLLVVLRDGTEVVASRSASERVRGLVR